LGSGEHVCALLLRQPFHRPVSQALPNTKELAEIEVMVGNQR
jgi:hypothetical protein